MALLCLLSLACCWKESAPLLRPAPRDSDSSGGGGGAREEGLTVLTLIYIVFNSLEKAPTRTRDFSVVKTFTLWIAKIHS